jgi:hypothetical protein
LSTVSTILDRLAGVVVLKERLAETNRNFDRSLDWLLDHEKRLLLLEASRQGTTSPQPPAGMPQQRIPGK